jgi:hypothetical protein
MQENKLLLTLVRHTWKYKLYNFKLANIQNSRCHNADITHAEVYINLSNSVSTKEHLKETQLFCGPSHG